MIRRNRPRAVAFALGLTAALPAALALTGVSTASAATSATSVTPTAVCPGPWLGRHGDANPSISADGRFVAWEGYPQANTTEPRVILLRDRQKGSTVELTPATDAYYEPVVSGNGRRVVFEGPIQGPVSDDTENSAGLYVYDRPSDTTTYEGLVRTATRPAISANGTFIAFERNIDDFGYQSESYRRNVDTDAEVMVSQNPLPVGNRYAGSVSLSADARFALFAVTAYVPPSGSAQGLFLRDIKQGTTTEIKGATGDSLANVGGILSPDGRDVGYGLDGRGWVFDRKTGTTTAVTPAPGGTSSGGGMSGLSNRARRVLYPTSYTVGDPDSGGDYFAPLVVRDVAAGTDTVVSAGAGGVAPGAGAYPGGITPNGRYVVFYTDASNLPGDTDSTLDVFVRDLKQGVTSLVSTKRAGGACE